MRFSGMAHYSSRLRLGVLHGERVAGAVVVTFAGCCRGAWHAPAVLPAPVAVLPLPFREGAGG